MKRIFITILCLFCVIGVAHACTVDEIDVFGDGTQCEPVKFKLVTTEIENAGTFSFYMSAAGTFYVDCGNGGVLSGTGVSGTVIVRDNINDTQYICTYSEPGVKTITFSGLATGYNSVAAANVPAIRFNGASSTLVAGIFGSLGAMFPTLSSSTYGGRYPRFYNTFSGCSNIKSSIPANLFSGVTGAPVENMFRATFKGCSKLSGSIPENLFSGISGVPSNRAFYEVFSGCASLTGTLPANLFAGISGNNRSVGPFTAAFQGCSGLIGYIPPTLLPQNMTGSCATCNIFNKADGLMRSCPCGTHQYFTGYEDQSNFYGHVSCEVGKKSNEHWNNGICTTDCTAGATQLKTSTGLDYMLLTDATSTHSISIKLNNKICHIPLANGVSNNAINVSWNGNIWHAVAPDEIMPVGFTGQPD